MLKEAGLLSQQAASTKYFLATAMISIGLTILSFFFLQGGDLTSNSFNQGPLFISKKRTTKVQVAFS